MTFAANVADVQQRRWSIRREDELIPLYCGNKNDATRSTWSFAHLLIHGTGECSRTALGGCSGLRRRLVTHGLTDPMRGGLADPNGRSQLQPRVDAELFMIRRGSWAPALSLRPPLRPQSAGRPAGREASSDRGKVCVRQVLDLRGFIALDATAPRC